MIIKQYTVLCGLAISVQAHIKMNVPTPYGRSTLDNGPLLANGADFPCKLRPGVYALDGASNIYTLGSTNSLKFTSQAVHGGGSCQVSITYDSEPTKDSIWKVIKSIEGGCPARGQIGNMGEDPDAADPYEYEFTIPPNIPTGNGTIAWTWFNQIGNREMYMNCGPITLSGAGGPQANFDALPEMFKANINNDCYIPDNKDVIFPHPGQDVTRIKDTTDAFATPTGFSCGSVGTSRLTKPSSESTTLRSSVGASAIQPEVPQQSCIVSCGINSAMTAGTMCKSEGLWNCIEGKYFQRCAGGTWSVPQRLAAGTTCTPGTSANFRVEHLP